MEKIKEFFNKKYMKVILTAVRIIFAVMLVTFILMVCLQRFSGNKVSFFNLRMFTVVTGSMEPKYNVGDVLIAKEVKPSDVKVGDAVSYIGSNNYAGKIITHEVVDIYKDANDAFVYRTKGINNPLDDLYPVYENQLYGVVVYKVITLSFVYKIVGTSYGLFLFVILPLLYIIGSEILSIMLDNKAKSINK